MNSDWLRQRPFFVYFVCGRHNYSEDRPGISEVLKLTQTLPKIAEDDAKIFENYPRSSKRDRKVSKYSDSFQKIAEDHPISLSN